MKYDQEIEKTYHTENFEIDYDEDEQCECDTCKMQRVREAQSELYEMFLSAIV